MKNQILENVKTLPTPNTVELELTNTPFDEGETVAAMVIPFDINTGVYMVANNSNGQWQFPASHKQPAETVEELAKRIAFEELEGEFAALVPLGLQTVNINTKTPPQYYPYPFPKAKIAVFFAIAKSANKQNSKLFMPLKAKKLDAIKANQLFYNDGLEMIEKLTV